MPESFIIRDAAPQDVPQLFAMLRELAQFEKLEHQLVADEGDMHDALFGRRAGAEALVAQMGDSADATQPLIGYAIYFENFSTFLCRRGLYLEDIYVRPPFRRQGVGKTFLRRLAKLAQQRQCGRMEWVVLDWNQNAIDAYQAIGGEVLPDWRVVRLNHDAIGRLAGGDNCL